MIKHFLFLITALCAANTYSMEINNNNGISGMEIEEPKAISNTAQKFTLFENLPLEMRKLIIEACADNAQDFKGLIKTIRNLKRVNKFFHQFAKQKFNTKFFISKHENNSVTIHKSLQTAWKTLAKISRQTDSANKIRLSETFIHAAKNNLLDVVWLLIYQGD